MIRAETSLDRGRRHPRPSSKRGADLVRPRPQAADQLRLHAAVRARAESAEVEARYQCTDLQQPLHGADLPRQAVRWSRCSPTPGRTNRGFDSVLLCHRRREAQWSSSQTTRP
jgi:hypothetical protein